MTDIGIDDEFIENVSEAAEPGMSALFLLTRDANLEGIVDELSDVEFEIIETNLTLEDETRLREAFAAEEVAGKRLRIASNPPRTSGDDV